MCCNRYCLEDIHIRYPNRVWQTSCAADLWAVISSKWVRYLPDTSPVGGSPLYSSKIPLKPLQIARRDVYIFFNQSVTLQHIFHQQGDDPVSQHFCDLLLQQRTYSITQEDYNLLSTHFPQNLPDEEKCTFHDPIHLLSTWADVEDHNHHYLESAHIPVLRCKARHSGGRHAKQATEDQADGLEAELLLAIGARAMITWNIWTNRGITFLSALLQTWW